MEKRCCKYPRSAGLDLQLKLRLIFPRAVPSLFSSSCDTHQDGQKAHGKPWWNDVVFIFICSPLNRNLARLVAEPWGLQHTHTEGRTCTHMHTHTHTHTYVLLMILVTRAAAASTPTPWRKGNTNNKKNKRNKRNRKKSGKICLGRFRAFHFISFHFISYHFISFHFYSHRCSYHTFTSFLLTDWAVFSHLSCYTVGERGVREKENPSVLFFSLPV